MQGRFLCRGFGSTYEFAFEEDIERLTENIKVENLRMESAYLYDALFEKLEDKESLYWNYFDITGEFQIGWSYGGSFEEMKEIREREGL